MTKDEIKKELDKLEIPYKKGWDKDKLLGALGDEVGETKEDHIEDTQIESTKDTSLEESGSGENDPSSHTEAHVFDDRGALHRVYSLEKHGDCFADLAESRANQDAGWTIKLV